MELIPESLLNNRYRIIRQLGQGGMGAVYLAYDTALEHEVALKTNLQVGEKGSSQFLREAQLLARLRHPNLPRVIDYFLSEEIQCLVMDYIPGHDLRDILKEQGAQPLDKVLKWAGQLGSALSYLHHQTPPVIHRDIKPANIKLTPEGDVVLVDFGIAKSTDNTQATATGASGYTPGFAPPEQYGIGRTSPHSDQFGLAATLYMLLTNHQPADSIQRALGEAVLTPLTAIRTDIPVSVGDAIEKGLAVRTESRFANVYDFINGLINPDTVSPKPQNLPDTPHAKPHSPSPLRRILPLGLGMAVIIVVAIGLILVTRFWGIKINPGPSATTPIVLQSTATITATLQVSTPTHVLKTATTEPLVVAQTPALETAQAINYLGSGKLIAFISDRGEDKTLQIWTMKVQMDDNNIIKSTDLKQVTRDKGNKQDPSWSFDGKWIVYSAPGPGSNGLDIWKLDNSTEGSQPIRLTDFKGDDTQPAWSPDGKTIAFTNRGRFNDINQIYFMDSDGGNIKRISFDFSETQPNWSPDSQWLLYVINAQSHNYFYMYNLNAMNATLKGTPQPTPQAYDNVEIFGRLGEVSDPAWSRDGQYLAYTRTEGLTKRIFSVRYKSRGGDLALLTQGAFKEKNPTWSPDGQWLAFTSERGPDPDIYLMTSTGLLQTNVSNAPGIDKQPAWQP